MQRDRVSTTHKETVYLEHKENVYLEPIHCAKRRTMSVKELVEVHSVQQTVLQSVAVCCSLLQSVAKRRTMSVKELVEVHRDLEVSLRIFWGL